MLVEFFVLWGFWFWLLIALECGFVFWAISYRRGGWALLSVLLVLLALQFFGNVPVFTWMWNNPGKTGTFAALFFPVGVAWAIAKWWLFVRDNLFRYNEILEEFLATHKRKGFPEDPNQFTLEQKVAWKDYFDRHSYQDDTYEYVRVEFDPKINEHKLDIMTWLMFWPWSFLWTLLNDPIRKLCKHLYYWMKGVLQKISDIYWGNVRGHMPTEEELDEYRQKQQDEYRRKREAQQS